MSDLDTSAQLELSADGAKVSDPVDPAPKPRM